MEQELKSVRKENKQLKDLVQHLEDTAGNLSDKYERDLNNCMEEVEKCKAQMKNKEETLRKHALKKKEYKAKI